MRFIADLHIHSKYSRATSRDMSPENIWRWAQLKGVSLIGTGDFTHPEWMRELKEKLEPAGNGLFRLKKEFYLDNVPDSCKADIFFILSAEISCIYSKNGRTRRIHSLLFVPGFKEAERISKALSGIGNLAADGRPILGMDAKKLLKITMDASPDSMFIPAHAWTPHFSVFGAASGFDSLEDCFEELSTSVCAIETGLSSDPSMNWRLSALDRITLISNSDAHSPLKIGREANILNTEISYSAVSEAIRNKKGLAGTIEFFPEEGKYHNDGHRDCDVSLSPKETIKNNYLCPVCGKKVTVGVLHRVEKLADREEGFRPADAPQFYSIIPLAEIISETLRVGVSSKSVLNVYSGMLEKLGSEFSILLDAKPEDIEAAASSQIRDAVSRMRAGHVNIAPGFDGVYGKIEIFEDIKRKEAKGIQRFSERR